MLGSYGVVVSSSVGLGDVVSDSESGKLFSIFLMLIGTCFVATSITSVADAYLLSAQKKLADNILHSRLTPSSIRAIDTDHDGHVSKKEWLEFMLVHMKLVEQHIIDDINERFEELDLDHSGDLDLRDILSQSISRRSLLNSFPTAT